MPGLKTLGGYLSTFAMAGALAACGSNPTNVELRAGGQYAVLGDVEAQWNNEDIELGDEDLSGEPLTNLRISSNQFAGNSSDLSAVLNACEAAAAVCELTVYDSKQRVLARWSLRDVSVSPETRDMIRRGIARAAAGAGDDAVGPLTLHFDIATLLLVELPKN